MKKIFFIIIIIQTNFTFSQSKKEQIKLLTENVDSLKTVLENERNFNFKKAQERNCLIPKRKRGMTLSIKQLLVSTCCATTLIS